MSLQSFCAALLNFLMILFWICVLSMGIWSGSIETGWIIFIYMLFFFLNIFFFIKSFLVYKKDSEQSLFFLFLSGQIWLVYLFYMGVIVLFWNFFHPWEADMTREDFFKCEILVFIGITTLLSYLFGRGLVQYRGGNKKEALKTMTCNGGLSLFSLFLMFIWLIIQE